MLKFLFILGVATLVYFLYKQYGCKFLLDKGKEKEFDQTNDDSAKIIKKQEQLAKELSEDEKIELSWQFLYKITDYVLNKFSKKDSELVNVIGSKLANSGMTYQHVVEYGIMSVNKENAKNISDERNTQKSKQVCL